MRFAIAAVLFASACNNVAADAQSSASIALDMTAPRPTAQLVIGDADPVTAIFDTGAAASVLRLSYAERIGVPNQGPASAHGPNGAPVSGFRTRIDDARLGDASFTGAMAVALDIPLPLEGVDAIIGPGVFSGRLVRFDFPAGIAHVVPRTADNTPSGEATPYHGENTHGRVRRIPAVRVDIPGAPEIVAIADSGSARGLLLPLTLAHSLPLSEPLTSGEPVRMVGAQFPSLTSRINGNVRIGPLTIENPQVRFADGIGMSVVGMEILRDAILVLDPAEHRSWLLAAD
ncbi:hypothetical protein U91I_04205 [alpha proteobacterium U9-1i]|nr:hypothetical protein U91I_04205 [alpha proteobacterium U9-1i]